MAKKFGGKFSPGGAAQPAPEPVAAKDQPRDRRVGLLYVPPVILALTSLNDGPVILVMALIGAAVLAMSAWLLQEGLKAEAAFNARKVARKPAFPRKMAASLLTGVGVAVAAYTGDSGVVGSALYGVAALGLHLLTFGLDPLADKRVEGIDTFQQDRVAKVVDEAEAHLDVIKGQIAALSDRKLGDLAEDFMIAARRMIRTVEEDPRDLTAARKFLGVYLMGARDATVKFADLYGRNKDADARTNFEALLTDLTGNFAARTEKMLLDDRSDMDIEIKVLRDRLQQEGVSLSIKGSE